MHYKFGISGYTYYILYIDVNQKGKIPAISVKSFK